MKERLFRAANIVLFCLVVLVLGTLQTSLWFQIFGYFPAPALWIPAVIYMALYRGTLEAIIVVYIFCLTISTMTAMSIGLLVASAFVLVIATQSFRQRIFWNTNSYIMMVTGVGTLLFHLAYWIFSAFFDDYSLHSPEILDWILEALLTPLVAPPLFKVFIWLDQITRQVQPSIASAEVV
jgi:hypothetical protein